MTIKIIGLPPDYRVDISHNGKRYVLVLPDWDYPLLIAEWNYQPTLFECLEAIAKNGNK